MKPEQRAITGREDLYDLSSPVQALVEFYRAFNTRDLAGVELNWAASEEVSMDNPLGGIKRGWTEIQDVYARIFNGPAHVYVEFHDYTLHMMDQVFYAAGRERGHFQTADANIQLAIRTSRIYQLIEERWKQVHHHGSIDDPELLAAYQRAVRGGVR